ncbi:hypothetical protein QAD02_014674, partial [Eretmocerus hayati]
SFNGMPSCAVVKCKNYSSKNVKMCYIPRNPQIRDEWIRRINRPGWTPNSSSAICQYHFEDCMWEKARVDGTLKLKWNAIPTLFGEQVHQVGRGGAASGSIQHEERSPTNNQPHVVQLSDNAPRVDDHLHDLPVQSNRNMNSVVPCSDNQSANALFASRSILSSRRALNSLNENVLRAINPNVMRNVCKPKSDDVMMTHRQRNASESLPCLQQKAPTTIIGTEPDENSGQRAIAPINVNIQNVGPDDYFEVEGTIPSCCNNVDSSTANVQDMVNESQIAEIFDPDTVGNEQSSDVDLTSFEHETRLTNTLQRVRENSVDLATNIERHIEDEDIQNASEEILRLEHDYDQSPSQNENVKIEKLEKVYFKSQRLVQILKTRLRRERKAKMKLKAKVERLEKQV